MINFSTLILSSEVSGPGGLFDINATLPLVAIQFVILMIMLNTLLFNPLLTIIEERKEYILTKLGKASKALAEANRLTGTLDNEISDIRKQEQLKITNSQKIYKEILDLEVYISQKYLDDLLNTIMRDIGNKKTSALNNLEDSVKSLCDDINIRLSI